MEKQIETSDVIIAEQFKEVKRAELKEAKSWIENGKIGVVWHWESEEKQQACLEGSYNYFLTKTDQRTEEAIIHFVGQEVHDLWNEYNDDTIINRCNHATALYNYIKEQLSNIL